MGCFLGVFVVPSARIELATDPYQGPVRPLNYEGLLCLVPQERLELSRREASVPKTDVSANSTIGAVVLGMCQGVEL